MKPITLLPKLLILIALSGCATTHNYENALRSWMGHDFNELVNEWGPPSSTYDTPNGSKLYTYLNNSGALTDSQYLRGTNQSFGYSRNRWCQTTFTVNALTNRITNWAWRGNNCTY